MATEAFKNLVCGPLYYSICIGLGKWDNSRKLPEALLIAKRILSTKASEREKKRSKEFEGGNKAES